MNKYIKKYKKEFKLTHSKKEELLKWIKKLENNELKDEVANYGLFSRIILERILGYNYEKNIQENVKEQYGSGFSEFALKKDDTKFMVIELKGQDNNLDKPQNRKNDKRTPVDQAFDYAKRSGDIDWILVSNYKEFRLYNWHKKQHQYISFEVEEIQDPEVFKQFMLIFSKFSIENNLTEKLLTKTHFVERELEDEFYKLYSETRLMLIAELEHVHSEFTREESVHYAQLILNRYIFICFAEDLGLLPEEISVESIQNPVKNHDLGHNEIWHRLNKLFIYINEGNKHKNIYGYNGGLFSGDKNSKFDESPEFIESLNIRDIVEDHSIFKNAYQKWKFEEYSLIVEEKLIPYNKEINPIYKNLLTISSFDFNSELDVNILGHIFENSIGEIEELKADTKGRRKKDGIFYTPEHITDYICCNTIIPYLSKSGKINTVPELIEEYRDSINELDEKVEKIKIIDIACGSGAFLNKASDILLKIHITIREHKYKDDKTLMPFIDNIEERRKILLNNIYGVDINEESAEITKLSLFLKVCKSGLKLPNLDNNIKCGNSLVDDPKYTDKPFNWDKEFKHILESGGFDIVIGNPPYVRHHGIKNFKPYLKDRYAVYTGLSDIYVYFFELGVNILKKEGILGYISSNKFIKVNYGKPLRKYILDHTSFMRYVDHTWDKVFEGATVHSSIIILKKGISSKNKILVDDDFEIKQSELNESSWSFVRPELIDLKNKINKRGIKLKSIENINFHIGIMTGFNEAFIIDKYTKDQLISKDPKCIDVIKPLIRGKDVKRWKIDYQDLYLILSKSGDRTDLEYPAILEHFEKYLEKLEVRWNKGKYWFNLRDCDYYSEFEKPKLIYPEISPKLFAVYDESGFYTNAKCFIITSDTVNLKYLSSLLSSKTLNFVFKFLGSTLEGKRFNLSKSFLEELPIYSATLEQQEPIIEKTDKMIKLNKDLVNEINGFKKWLKRTYEIEKLSKKLDKYYELSFDEFLIEIKKKKVDVNSRKVQELLKKEFDDSLNIINPLLLEIEKSDNEIDQMVYELYGLSDDEIKIIEDTLN
ncbi:Eco57I restriction-modification methylase domain-containing protein [Methanobacterium sp.]